MPLFKALVTSSALAVLASATDAATLTFDIEAEVSHVNRYVEADVASGDTMRVRGKFDTDSLFRTRIDNRMRFGEVADVRIDGPVFGDHDDFVVSLLEVRDDEAGVESDLFRLIIDFQNGPSVNDHDYDRVRLSFYIPMPEETLDVPTFLALENEMNPLLEPAANGRTAVMAGAFRFPTTTDGRNTGFRGEVTSLRLAPIPLPASSVLLLTIVGGLGVAGRRKKT